VNAMTTRARKRVRILAGIAVLAAAACVWWLSTGKSTLRPSDALTLYGNVDIREIDLAFQGDQRIAEILVEEGDQVKKGEVLARMETDRLAAAVALARARLAQQEQVVARLRAGSRPEEVERTRADLAAAAGVLRNAELDYTRAQDLVKRRVDPQRLLDDRKAALDTARGRHESQKQTLQLALLGPRDEDIAAAVANGAANKAALALAEKNLADAELRAPAAAIVRDRIQEPGEIASPQRPALTLALTDPIWVRCYVPEPELGRIRLGSAATIHTDSFPDASYEGWVGYISPTAEFTPKSVETPDLRTRLVYQARVFVHNPNGELRLGMPATVVISLRPANDATDGAAKSPTRDR